MHQVINQINIIQIIDKFIDESEVLIKNIKNTITNEDTCIEYLEIVISIFNNTRLNLIKCTDGIDIHQYKNILSTCKDLNDHEFDFIFLEKLNNLLESFLSKKVDFFLFFFSKYNFEKQQLDTLHKVIPIIKYYKKINKMFEKLSETHDVKIFEDQYILLLTKERLTIRDKYLLVKDLFKKCVK